MTTRSLGALTIDLVARTFGFEQGLDKASRKAKSSGKEIEAALRSSFKATGAILAGGAAVVGGALAGLTKDAIDTMDKLDELSQRFKIGTETLSAWGYAASLTGTDIETVARSIGILSKNMAAALDDDSRMAKLFQSLGIQVKDANGNLRDVQEVLPEIADRFKVLDNSTTETALAMELLGKSGAEMLEFLNLGKQGLSDYKAELADLGGLVTPEAAESAAQFKDELDKLHVAGQGLGILVAGQLTDSLADTTKEFRQLVTDGRLAANVVTLIDGAMSAGIGTINAYNQAVAVTSETIEGLVKYAQGTHMITNNLLSFGLADGGVVEGLQQQVKAVRDTIDARERIIQEMRAGAGNAPAVIFAGEGPEPAGLFKMSEDELQLRKEYAALQERLGKMFAGGTAAPKAAKPDKSLQDAMRATREMVEAQEGWHERLLDLQADLGGPVAQVTRDYQKQLAELDAAFAAGKVTLADYAQLQETITGNRERDLKAAREQLTPAEQFIEDLRAENALLAATTDGQLRLTAARYAGKDATAAQVEEAYELLKVNEELADAQQNWDELNHSIADGLFDIATGAESATGAIKNFIDDLNRQVLHNITQDWADALTDALKGFANGASGSGGSWLGSLLGAFGFGGGKASGGWTSPYTVYQVNELGLEMATVRGRDYMLTGKDPVHITPANRTGGGFQQNVTFNVAGRIDRRTQDQITGELLRQGMRSQARNGR
jgi:hypothetical protein